MNQEVIYSILLSPVKTQAEKEKRKEGGRCYTYILTPGSLFEVVSKVGFFKTGISRKWTFVPWRVTHNIDGITLEVFNHTHTDSQRHAKPCGSRGRNSSNTPTQKQSTIFPSINFFHLSTDLSVHFSLHPSSSPSIPLQSLQSAVSYRIPLQSSDAALQRMESCTCVTAWVCTCAIQCEWAILFIYLFCFVQGISSSGTQRWCPQPIFILQCVQTVFFLIWNVL